MYDGGVVGMNIISYNKETGRAATQEFFGIACYLGTFGEDNVFTGTHQGILGEVDQALRWVNGDEDVPLIRVHNVS